jgi:hypothetical protein
MKKPIIAAAVICSILVAGMMSGARAQSLVIDTPTSGNIVGTNNIIGVANLDLGLNQVAAPYLRDVMAANPHSQVTTLGVIKGSKAGVAYETAQYYFANTKTGGMGMVTITQFANGKSTIQPTFWVGLNKPAVTPTPPSTPTLDPIPNPDMRITPVKPNPGPIKLK